jgi:replication factor A1
MTGSLDEIIGKIVSHSGKDHSEITQLIQEKMAELGGLLTEESAAYLIAKELGVDLSPAQTSGEMSPLQIIDLTSGLSSISITGKIMSIYGVSSFSRRDETIGHRRSIQLADKSGEARLVLWDEAALNSQTLELEKGSIIRILSAYTKDGQEGDLEIHGGNKTVIEMIADANKDEYPEIKVNKINIDQITTDSKNFDVVGKVVSSYPAKTFSKKDGSDGKVLNLMVADLSGEIRTTFWDANATKVEEIIKKENVILQISNPQVKESTYTNNLELSIGSYSSFNEVEDKSLESVQATQKPKSESKEMEISEIEGSGTLAIVTGIIVDVGQHTIFFRKDGSEGKVGAFTMKDKTGQIRVTLWDDQTKHLTSLEEGMTVKVKNFAQREGQTGFELHSRFDAEIEINPEGAETFSKSDLFTDLALVEDGQYNLSILVKVDRKFDTNVFEKEDGSEGRVQNIKVKDMTGDAQLTAWNDEIDKFHDITQEMWIEVTKVRSKITDKGTTLTINQASKLTEVDPPAEAHFFESADELEKKK